MVSFMLFLVIRFISVLVFVPLSVACRINYDRSSTEVNSSRKGEIFIQTQAKPKMDSVGSRVIGNLLIIGIICHRENIRFDLDLNGTRIRTEFLEI